MVSHGHQLATRLEDSVDLPQRSFRVWGVVHDAPGVDEVKGFVGKWEILCISSLEIDAIICDPERSKVAARVVNGSIGQVDAMRIGPATDEA